MPDYIPGTDAGKLSFAKNFVTLITPDPLAWGLDAATAAQAQTLLDAYEASYNLAKEPATQSRANTFQKNQDRDALVNFIRRNVHTIQGTKNVSDSMRHDLGITVRGANPPTPINPPAEAPIISIQWVKNRQIAMRLHPADAVRRGRPAGVMGASICMYAGPLPLPTELSAWSLIGETTRMSLEVELPATVLPGTNAYLVAYWKNPRLMSGPPSAPVSIHIGGGVQQLA